MSNAQNRHQASRVKYDYEYLIHYLFDGAVKTSNINVIKICKVKVQRIGGTVLSHYFAKIHLSTDYSFEFHPGSQPKTFENSQNSGILEQILIVCDNCCKLELKTYIEGENSFNILINNCEKILCKRQSCQSIILILVLMFLVLNLFKFSFYNVVVVVLLLFMLYINNNYMISPPKIYICPHLNVVDERF